MINLFPLLARELIKCTVCNNVDGAAFSVKYSTYAGLCRCFTNTDCTGDEVTVADQRGCCVETDNGLSYNDGTTCTLCIGS